MDPQKAQADKANDTHSLESGGDKPAKDDNNPANDQPQETTSADGKVTTTDASGEQSNVKPAAPPAKVSGLKRFWQKFNIYLVLFILVVVLAAGLLVVMTVQSRRIKQIALNPQGLSSDALEQLANTDVTVGDAKQILTVQSNAVFAGSVLVRSNMEVAGSLKVGGSLSLSDLTVSGKSSLNDVDAVNLTVGNNLSLQGSLSVKNGLSVSGSSKFTGDVVVGSLSTGSLSLIGDLNLTHHIVAGGTIPTISKGSAVGSGGTVSLSGSDTSGSVVINTGSSPPAGCFATITFSEAFNSTPHVVITPVGSGAAELNYYITRSTTSFTICTTNVSPAAQTFGFDYVVLA